jgi:Tfp pilus assembly protein PilO
MRISGFHLAVFLRRFWERLAKDPRLSVRMVLGVLLVANLVAAAAVFRPWGGSQEALQQQLTELRQAVHQREQAVERLRAVAGTVEKTRAESDQFLERYFLPGQTAYSTVLEELRSVAEKSGVRAKDHSFDIQPIEGSDTLDLMNVTGNYEGSFANLVEFVNAIDRSPRFLTIERLQAAPLQTQGTLNINLRINVFVRREAEAQ